MKRMGMEASGKADLVLMKGGIPPWLFDRMKKLALPVVEAILMQYGKAEFLARLSDPFWFQSFSSVIGMDWNTSGATTAVTNALKQALNPVSKELGLFICGGKGKASLQTPTELLNVGYRTGLDGNELAKFSKLTAKVDSTAVQDGFQVYLHSFIASDEGDWSVIQQGMHIQNRKARRYHWHSGSVDSFTDEPHAAICGLNDGQIINLVDHDAQPAQQGILDISKENPEKILKEIPHLVMSGRMNVRAKDIDLKRLGSVLWLAQENETKNFEDLLLLRGLGPRTLQSLTLVSEVIHGTPSRFSDPARFVFANGAKRGHPFPVLTKVYDETISALTTAVEKAKLQQSDKLQAIQKFSELAYQAEKHFEVTDTLETIIQKENEESDQYGGRFVGSTSNSNSSPQLSLFD